ncbi:MULTISPECIES: hypothetical protein [Myxococcus]|nr:MULTISPECIES: hypothetical protein [Myxococcus]WAM28818.1 hypothetical protein OZ403_12145 [Myxococcus sp. NMCA1]
MIRRSEAPLASKVRQTLLTEGATARSSKDVTAAVDVSFNQ